MNLYWVVLFPIKSHHFWWELVRNHDPFFSLPFSQSEVPVKEEKNSLL